MESSTSIEISVLLYHSGNYLALAASIADFQLMYSYPYILQRVQWNKTKTQYNQPLSEAEMLLTKPNMQQLM